MRGKWENPLLTAAFWGRQSEIERLLAEGADPNGADEEGLTALMLAAGNGFADGARILLEAGADWRLKSKEGATAEDFARSGGVERVARLLADWALSREEAADMGEGVPGARNGGARRGM